MAHHQYFPVFCASAEKDMGSGRIMGFIHDVCPSPADRPAASLEGGGSKPCEASARPCVFIFKTVNEPKVGLVSYFKVYSGTLRTGDELANATNGIVERFGQLYESEGKNRDAVNRTPRWRHRLRRQTQRLAYQPNPQPQRLGNQN